MKWFKLFKVIERSASKGWRGVLENTRRTMGLFTKALLCVYGSLTRGHCLAVYAIGREILSLYRKNGALHTALYLKQVAFLLQWYIGGDKTVQPKMKIFVSLTRSGIPRIIPPSYRKLLRRRDPLVIRIILTLCTLIRLMLVPPKGGMRIKPTTIHIPGFRITDECKSVCEDIILQTPSLMRRYIPSYLDTALELGYQFKPIFTSGPNTYRNPVKETCIEFGNLVKSPLTIYHTLPIDASGIFERLGLEGIITIGKMWFTTRTINVIDGTSNPITPDDDGVSGFGWLIETLLEPAIALWWETMETRSELGRLGRKLEGGGKVRVFAIANPLLQTLLRPLHDWLMRILGTIPTDGTFDQHKPLHRLKGHRELFSFDLKSATDLLPVDNTVALFTSLFGHEFAQSWCFLMTKIGFRSPDPGPSATRGHVYKFTRGQPLGYYSSWPSFTLTHHMFVWMAAETVYPGQKFVNYAILGDDIVIADAKVAEAYKTLLTKAMGVISIEKSLVSYNGCCEFAKRFIINNHLDSRQDVSPLSMPLIRSCSGFTAPFVFSTLNCSLLNSFRLKGGGYRVFSQIRANRLPSRLSRRWTRHWLSMFCPSGIKPLPLMLWLSFPERGIITAYEWGMLRQFVLDRVKPPDLDEKSFERLRLFWANDEENLLERHLVSFVKLHLSYLKWYADGLMDFNLSLEYYLSPPIAPRGIKRISIASEVKRYGIIFKLWDYLRSKSAPLAISVGDNRRADVLRIHLFRYDPVKVNLS